jgi:hypothetical protein
MTHSEVTVSKTMLRNMKNAYIISLKMFEDQDPCFDGKKILKYII